SASQDSGSRDTGTGVCAEAAAGKASAAAPAPSAARLALVRTLQLLAQLRVGLLAVRAPRDLPVAVDHVERRQRLHPVLLRDGAGEAGPVEASGAEARVEQGRERKAVEAVVGEHAGRVLRVGVDRDDGEAPGWERLGDLLHVLGLRVAEAAPRR